MTCTECSICFDEITASTGSTTLSCGHVFHFGCIAKWFLNADEQGPSTCALCRKEMAPIEDVKKYFNDMQGDEDEGDDDETYEDDEDSDEEEDPVVVQRRVLDMKVKLESMTKEQREIYASTKIQSAWRRCMVMVQVIQVQDSKRWLERCEERLNQAKIELKVSQESLRLGQPQWKKRVATKVQAIWRGYRVRNVSFALAVKEPVRDIQLIGEGIRVSIQ